MPEAGALGPAFLRRHAEPGDPFRFVEILHLDHGRMIAGPETELKKRDRAAGAPRRPRVPGVSVVKEQRSRRAWNPRPGVYEVICLLRGGVIRRLDDLGAGRRRCRDRFLDFAAATPDGKIQIRLRRSGIKASHGDRRSASRMEGVAPISERAGRSSRRVLQITDGKDRISACDPQISGRNVPSPRRRSPILVSTVRILRRTGDSSMPPCRVASRQFSDIKSIRCGFPSTPTSSTSYCQWPARLRALT